MQEMAGDPDWDGDGCVWIEPAGGLDRPPCDRDQPWCTGTRPSNPEQGDEQLMVFFRAGSSAQKDTRSIALVRGE